jgi:hypothetical protein
MVLVFRRFLAVLAGCGLATSIAVYVQSFRGTTFDSLKPLSFVLLHLGVFVLVVPMVAIEFSSFSFEKPPWIWFSGGRPIERGSFSWKGYAQGASVWEETFYWKQFSQGMPKWVVPTIRILGLFFIFCFILFLVQSHAASPQIEDGQYVLNNQGQIVKVLTQLEYFKLKAAELRMFAAGWVFFYFVPTMYWWFPRGHQVSMLPAPQ